MTGLRRAARTCHAGMDVRIVGLGVMGVVLVDPPGRS
jgi:hypothetical protein